MKPETAAYARKAGLLLLLAALPLAVFAQTASFGFVNYDDVKTLVDSALTTGLTRQNVAAIFTHYTFDVFYPVTTLSYAVDRELWGLSPGAFHAVNLFLHLANVLLVFLLARTAVREAGAKESSFAAGLFAGALFAVHPAAAQPVAWLPGREELLMLFFALAALHLHIRALKGGPASAALHLLASAAAFLAALSQVAMAFLPVGAALYQVLIAGRRRAGRILVSTSGLWAAAGTAVFLRVLSWLTYSEDTSALLYPHLPTALANLPAILGSVGQGGGSGLFHKLALLVPKWLFTVQDGLFPWFFRALDVPDKHLLFDPLRVVSGVLALGGLAALGYFFRRDRAFLFGLLWFVLALFPAAALAKGPLP
ncbi:MAG: hypothetical protein JRI97_05280, partial [Deltaproteobacteria bacterium]|nr:hypothetical protein [Deltaproteobacteria bacterium]